VDCLQVLGHSQVDSVLLVVVFLSALACCVVHPCPQVLDQVVAFHDQQNCVYFRLLELVLDVVALTVFVFVVVGQNCEDEDSVAS